MELIVSFPDNIEVSSGKQKRFKDECVTDPKCLLKVETTSFYFDNNLSFSINIIFFVYCYFYFISTVYMLSKMVWNYNKHLVSHSTAIWLVYLDFPPGFVVA